MAGIIAPGKRKLHVNAALAHGMLPAPVRESAPGESYPNKAEAQKRERRRLRHAGGSHTSPVRRLEAGAHTAPLAPPKLRPVTASVFKSATRAREASLAAFAVLKVEPNDDVLNVTS
jgi:hypothetical protein